MIAATEEQIAAAFAKWDKEYRENPEAFANRDRELLRGKDPAVSREYGERAKDTFLDYLKEVK